MVSMPIKTLSAIQITEDNHLLVSGLMNNTYLRGSEEYQEANFSGNIGCWVVVEKWGLRHNLMIVNALPFYSLYDVLETKDDLGFSVIVPKAAKPTNPPRLRDTTPGLAIVVSDLSFNDLILIWHDTTLRRNIEDNVRFELENLQGWIFTMIRDDVKIMSPGTFLKEYSVLSGFEKGDRKRGVSVFEWRAIRHVRPSSDLG